jgi:hypothetical protein
MAIGVTGSSDDYCSVDYKALAEIGDAKEALFLLFTGKIVIKECNFSNTQNRIDVIVPSNIAFSRYDNIYSTGVPSGFRRAVFRVYRDTFTYNNIKQSFIWTLDYINKILYYQIITE